MKRTIQVLLVLLIIQVVIMAAVYWPQNTAQAIDKPLLPDVSSGQVTGLAISDGEGNRLMLANKGGEWILPEASDFPVDSEKVQSLLDKLTALKSNRLVTQTEASHKRLGVDKADFNRSVEISLDDGTQHTIYIGTSAGVGATPVRVDDQSEVFLSEVEPFDVNPQASAWIDTLYQNVSQDEVLALTLENQQSTFVFQKDGGTWGMLDLAEDAVFDESNFSTLLNQVTSVRMIEPLGTVEKEEYNLQAPLATVTLTTAKDGVEKTYSLKVGAKIGDGYVIKSSESPYYVLVGEFTANNLLEKSQDDFLVTDSEEPTN